MRIVYLSWPATEVTGGIKAGMRHVEFLLEAGIAAIVAAPGGQAPGWFQTKAPIVDVSALAPGDDILVFPENHFPLLESLRRLAQPQTGLLPQPVLCLAGIGKSEPLRRLRDLGAICTGRHVAEFFRLRFPSLPIVIVPTCTDLAVFRFQAQKKLQIAFSPHKRPLEAGFIRDLFRASKTEHSKLPWVEIAKLSEEQVAARLGETAVYLSLCRFESFSQSILEAMACGCVVAGFTGFGARQYTTTRNGYWADEDDCLDCVEQLGRAVRLVVEGGPAYRDMLEAAHFTARQHGRDVLAAQVVAFWKGYLETGRFPSWT